MYSNILFMHNNAIFYVLDWPMIWGREYPSRSSRMLPVCRQVRSSNRLCRDSVDTWGLLHLSPPFSTFSSNFTHLWQHTHTNITHQSLSQERKHTAFAVKMMIQVIKYYNAQTQKQPLWGSTLQQLCFKPNWLNTPESIKAPLATSCC